MSPKKSIDPEARQNLAEIQTPGEPELYLKLVGIFLEDSKNFLSKINSSIESSTETSAIAHAWKSSSYTVGAKQLGDLCQQLELLLPNQISEKLAVIDMIKAEFACVEPELIAQI
jgi:HPt (histidine-containing phosphotransfer) domain-containing protein